MSGLDQKLEDIINKATNKIVDERIAKIENFIDKEVADPLCDEIIEIGEQELKAEGERMYKEYIKKYYEYKTREYIRHGEEVPGTRKGTNLYSAEQFNINEDGVDFLINSDPMEDYQNKNVFKPGDELGKEGVLEMVMSGKRRIPRVGNRYRFVEWKYSYNGKYVKSTKGKNLYQAMEYLQSEKVAHDAGIIIGRKLIDKKYSKIMKDYKKYM